MTEEWRPVVGFEDCYEVSNLGNCRALEREVLHADGRLRTFPARLLTLKYNSQTGYVQHSLYRGNKSAQRYGHRLVAESFIPNPLGKKYVNHLDGVRSNNIWTNLQWATHKENMQHAYATGLAKALRGEANKNSKINWQSAQKLRSDVWDVIEAWAEEHGVHTQTAWDVIAGRNWISPI